MNFFYPFCISIANVATHSIVVLDFFLPSLERTEQDGFHFPFSLLFFLMLPKLCKYGYCIRTSLELFQVSLQRSYPNLTLSFCEHLSKGCIQTLLEPFQATLQRSYPNLKLFQN
ncbi:hypothetical protein AAZV13_05G084000 [Glycine max]